jgi:hypothetical protein
MQTVHGLLPSHAAAEQEQEGGSCNHLAHWCIQHMGTGDAAAATSRIDQLLELLGDSMDAVAIDSNLLTQFCGTCQCSLGAYAYKKDDGTILCHFCGSDASSRQLLCMWPKR